MFGFFFPSDLMTSHIFLTEALTSYLPNLAIHRPRIRAATSRTGHNGNMLQLLFGSIKANHVYAHLLFPIQITHIFVHYIQWQAVQEVQALVSSPIRYYGQSSCPPSQVLLFFLFLCASWQTSFAFLLAFGGILFGFVNLPAILDPAQILWLLLYAIGMIQEQLEESLPWEIGSRPLAYTALIYHRILALTAFTSQLTAKVLWSVPYFHFTPTMLKSLAIGIHSLCWYFLWSAFSIPNGRQGRS